jgi:hypothetical protein
MRLEIDVSCLISVIKSLVLSSFPGVGLIHIVFDTVCECNGPDLVMPSVNIIISK